MNGIVITEKNFNSVAARMVKFFNGADIIQWHSFDCGMKQHILLILFLILKSKEENISDVYIVIRVSLLKLASLLEGNTLRFVLIMIAVGVMKSVM